MWAILEQLRDHATTIVGLVTALTLMYISRIPSLAMAAAALVVLA